MNQQPYFFLVVVMDANGYELKFAVHDSDIVKFTRRVDAVLKHITERGYKPVQSREAWLRSLTEPQALTF